MPKMLLLRELPDGLAIKGADLVPGVSLLYKDGMICDTDADYSCATCKHFFQSSNTAGPLDLGRCNVLFFTVANDFGCVAWQPR